MARYRPRQHGVWGSPGGGFTMVELLVVLLILGILLALVVGISKYIMAETARKQTVATQRVVMNAIERYRDATGSYPADSGDCVSLMSSLFNNAASKEVLRDLSKEAWATQGAALLDGFGEAMKYQQQGGFGGSPVLISKGADRVFDNSDDVRSDRQ